VSRTADLLLAHHLAFRPVDATFMGVEGHDDRLPDASAGAAEAERQGIAETRAAILAEPAADEIGPRLDRRLALGQLACAESALRHQPRFANPAWYTGEAAFSIIGLLLPQARPTPHDAVRARLAALPDFLADGRARLQGGMSPTARTARATREAAAFALFLREDIRLHTDWDESWAIPAARAADALDAFAAEVVHLPDTAPGCGHDHIALLMREGHGLDLTPEAALTLAERRFAEEGEALRELAARVDPARSVDEIVAGLARHHQADADTTLARYKALDAEARAAGAALVTVADDYGLDYRWMAPCFRRVAGVLYFLFYRSPPAAGPGAGSLYWVSPPGPDMAPWLAANSDTNVKVIHAVHHGSVGHHTQNARARTAASKLARVAGTDCAWGLSMLSSGTMVEGWACYVQDMMAEAPGFYSDEELVALKQMARRNWSSVLVDIRLATGEWSPDEAAAFYRDEGDFAPARIAGEVTRNAMLPGTRLMYALGVDMIRDLRARWTGDTRAFHDTLIGHGHVPVAWAGEEMARAGQLG